MFQNPNVVPSLATYSTSEDKVREQKGNYTCMNIKLQCVPSNNAGRMVYVILSTLSVLNDPIIIFIYII